MFVRSAMRSTYRTVNGVLSLIGLQIVREEQITRPTMETALRHVRDLGILPRTVIDVGAAYGDWSAACHRVFPSARYLLVEPLREFADFLNNSVQELGNASYIPAASAGADGNLTIHVHPDLVGSSLLMETEGGGVDGFDREVACRTVDGLVQDHEAPGPYLLKADVQGAELEVLRGATDTLKSTDLVILEVSFSRFFLDGPEFHEVVAFMCDAGFVMYDILNLMYRPLDGALAQADVLFVPHGSPLRKRHGYASPEQRRLQDLTLRRAYNRRHRRLASMNRLFHHPDKEAERTP